MKFEMKRLVTAVGFVVATLASSLVLSGCGSSSDTSAASDDAAVKQETEARVDRASPEAIRNNAR